MELIVVIRIILLRLMYISEIRWLKKPLPISISNIQRELNLRFEISRLWMDIHLPDYHRQRVTEVVSKLLNSVKMVRSMDEFRPKEYPMLHYHLSVLTILELPVIWQKFLTKLRVQSKKDSRSFMRLVDEKIRIKQSPIGNPRKLIPE